MAEKQVLSEILARMEKLAGDLAKLGVPPDAISSVMEHIEEYAELKEGLNAARAEQFDEDAYNVLASTQSVSNKTLKALKAHLRAFAEHVARRTLDLTEHYGDNLDALVDHIPPMSDQVESE